MKKFSAQVFVVGQELVVKFDKQLWNLKVLNLGFASFENNVGAAEDMGDNKGTHIPPPYTIHHRTPSTTIQNHTPYTTTPPSSRARAATECDCGRAGEGGGGYGAAEQ